MTSKVGQISNLSLFDHSDHTLKLCRSHQTKAQQAIADTIDDLFIHNPTFHDLFEPMLKGLNGSPLTFSVTHEAISIGKSGEKPSVLEFADLAPTEDSEDIIEKSQTLLRKIDSIYQRCIGEHHDHKTSRPLTRSRVSPLAVSPRSSRSSGSRRSSTGSESTVESDAEEKGSKRSRRPSPLSIETAPSKARPKAPARKRARARATEVDSPVAPPRTKAAAKPATSHAATSTTGLSTSKPGVRRAHANLHTTRPVVVDAATDAMPHRRASAAIDAATDAEPIVDTALTTTLAELTAARSALEVAGKREEAIRAFFAGVRESHPIIDHRHLNICLDIANTIEVLSTDKLPEKLIDSLKALYGPMTHSIFRNIYLMLSKKTTEPEPADEGERWKIGQKFFFEKGYLGTSLTTKELNQARADAIRFFVIISLANEFETSFLDGASPDKPAPDLIALYDMLPLNMRNKIEGQLWQIKNVGKEARSNYGHLAFHGLEGQTATDAERAQAIREFFEESIAK